MAQINMQSRLSDNDKRRLVEIRGIVALLCSIYLGLSVFTYDKWDKSLFTFNNEPVKNYGGVLGAYISDLLFLCIGVSSYMIPFLLAIYGIRRLMSAERNWFYRFAVVGLIFSVSIISELLSRSSFLNVSLSGGAIGSAMVNLTLNTVSTSGSYIIAIGLFIVSLLLLSPVSPFLFLAKKISDNKDKDDKIERPLDVKLQVSEPKEQEQEPQLTHLEHEVEIGRSEKEEELVRILDNSCEATKDGSYVLPPIELLAEPEERDINLKVDIKGFVTHLETKLAEYGITGKIKNANPGPVVTMYEFEPAPGVKISKVVSLADDIALASMVQSVRVYPIPGRAAIGIEVPNKERATVYLREIIASDSFQKSLSILTLALGKDISGMPVVTDLSRMPHLLVAGTTGSGKSVFMNTMILSLLYKATPDNVKMLMIDPKFLELSLYSDIPHLIAPVITNPKEASEALKRIVLEMERRYKILSEKGARSIDTFNRVCEPEERLPYIVVFIDELADLMFTAPKEVENSITRLAQMARASGIHLILATQRPSVDVITGLIKANFPARISFQVTTKIDSRTILDTQGAEQLLGKGDMLFMVPGVKIRRVHGAFVSEMEVKAVTDFIKSQRLPDYTAFQEMFIPSQEQDDDTDTSQEDEYYKKAKEYAESVGEISISGIQRRLKIGYNKAANIMEMFERDGLVGPPRGAGKPREYLGRK
ncbi:MAG: DNA translocase FtsK [Thermodesulfovibrionales bacterium]|nr:DNA translocase FtsK [Thermodesulfovibrionales bacterium]